MALVPRSTPEGDHCGPNAEVAYLGTTTCSTRERSLVLHHQGCQSVTVRIDGCLTRHYYYRMDDGCNANSTRDALNKLGMGFKAIAEALVILAAVARHLAGRIRVSDNRPDTSDPN